MPPSKFEANPMLRLRVKRASFSLFTLASSCSNAYFRAYAIIDFLADRFVFLNTVTYGCYGLFHSVEFLLLKFAEKMMVRGLKSFLPEFVIFYRQRKMSPNHTLKFCLSN